MRTSALVAEREREVRARLVGVLRELGLFQDIVECDNGWSAVETIRASCPDLLVIETRLGMMDGFAVFEEVLDKPLRFVVMITDEDRKTVDALREHEIPYLRRPIDVEEARETFERCQAVHTSPDRDLSHRLVAFLETVGRRRSYSDRLLVRDGRQMVIVDVDEIHWIESAGNYVRLHLVDDVHKMRSTLAGLERRLDPEQFLRIHRSIIVNVDQVKQIAPWNHGDFAVILRDGTRLNLSRGYRPGVERFLQRYSA